MGWSQYESGRITTLGIGTGFSDHAASYHIIENFRTRFYPSFRAVTFEGKAGWNFADMTSIYEIARISPGNSTISPYRSFYFGAGIAQSIPGQDKLYLLLAYGKYSSSIGEGRKVGSGNLLHGGLGYNIDDGLFVELTYMGGQLSGIDESVNIQDSEANISVTFSFGF